MTSRMMFWTCTCDRILYHVSRRRHYSVCAFPWSSPEILCQKWLHRCICVLSVRKKKNEKYNFRTTYNASSICIVYPKSFSVISEYCQFTICSAFSRNFPSTLRVQSVPWSKSYFNVVSLIFFQTTRFSRIPDFLNSLLFEDQFIDHVS